MTNEDRCWYCGNEFRANWSPVFQKWMCPGCIYVRTNIHFDFPNANHKKIVERFKASGIRLTDEALDKA